MISSMYQGDFLDVSLFFLISGAYVLNFLEGHKTKVITWDMTPQDHLEDSTRTNLRIYKKEEITVGFLPGLDIFLLVQQSLGTRRTS